MVRILIILTILLSSAYRAKAQIRLYTPDTTTSSPVAFKGAEKVILILSDNSEDPFKIIGQAFMSSEVGVGERDKEFGQLSSKPFRLKGNFVGAGNFMISAVINGNKVTLTPFYNANKSIRVINWIDNHSSLKGLTYKKQQGTEKAAFEKILEITNHIPHNKLIWSK